MTTYNSISDAINAAEMFFNEHFGHTSGVDIESANGTSVSFYSKEDPGMSDTFDCIVDDGYLRYCSNGGQVKTERVL